MHEDTPLLRHGKPPRVAAVRLVPGEVIAVEVPAIVQRKICVDAARSESAAVGESKRANISNVAPNFSRGDPLGGRVGHDTTETDNFWVYPGRKDGCLVVVHGQSEYVGFVQLKALDQCSILATPKLGDGEGGGGGRGTEWGGRDRGREEREGEKREREEREGEREGERERGRGGREGGREGRGREREGERSREREGGIRNWRG